jgi:hypothetical protein
MRVEQLRELFGLDASEVGMHARPTPCWGTVSTQSCLDAAVLAGSGI